MYLSDYQQDLLLYIQETPTRQVKIDTFTTEQQKELSELVAVGTIKVHITKEGGKLVGYYFI